MKAEEIVKVLKAEANPKSFEGMVRFGINPKNTLGISTPFLRKLAKDLGKNHALALQLWKTEIHEARILACFIDNPAEVSKKQVEAWALGFDSWDVCDQCCSTLFDKTSFAHQKAVEFSSRKEEFVKRTGFALMAVLAVHDKAAKNRDFEKFFPLIKRESVDERNFVKKAVNWALRQIGKRNKALNKKAIALAKQIKKIDSKPARWVASNALCELEGSAVQERLEKKA